MERTFEAELTDDDDEVVLIKLHRKSNDEFTSDEDGVEMSLEKAFRRVGYFGWFQIRFFLWHLLYQFPAVFNALVITFVGLAPEWTCLEDVMSTEDINQTLTDTARCELYDHEQNNCTPYYTDRFYSIAQEWDLLCDQSYKINLTQSGFFLGYLLGAYVLGTLGDMFGRRIVSIGYLIGLAFVQIIIALSPNFYVFAIGRILVGFLVPGSVSAYVMFCELTNASKRTLMSSAGGVLFGSAFGALALSAYLLANWRWVTGFTALSNLLLLLYYRYVPESPRWLLVSGREMEAKTALVDIARVNGRSLPSGFSLEIPPKPKNNTRLNFVVLFKHKTMRTRLLIMMLEWFTLVIVYYALSLGVGNFSDNLYLAFTLSGLVEIPSSLIVYFTLERIGRKWSNAVFLCIGGIACLVCSFVQFYQIDFTKGYLPLALSLLGKFSVAATFTIAYVYSPELLPTDLRSSGMGIVNVCGRLGGILAPLIILLDNHLSGLSMLIMGCLGTVSSILCLFLPETLNVPLTSTIAEVRK